MTFLEKCHVKSPKITEWIKMKLDQQDSPNFWNGGLMEKQNGLKMNIGRLIGI